MSVLATHHGVVGNRAGIQGGFYDKGSWGPGTQDAVSGITFLMLTGIMTGSVFLFKQGSVT